MERFDGVYRKREVRLRDRVVASELVKHGGALPRRFGELSKQGVLSCDRCCASARSVDAHWPTLVYWHAIIPCAPYEDWNRAPQDS